MAKNDITVTLHASGSVQSMEIEGVGTYIWDDGVQPHDEDFTNQMTAYAAFIAENEISDPPTPGE